MFFKSIIKLSPLVFLFCLTACGGGGSGSDGEDRAEAVDCELGSSTIGSCNL